MASRPCFGDSFALSPSLIAILSAAAPLSWYDVAAEGSTGWCYSCVGSHDADRGGISRLLLGRGVRCGIRKYAGHGDAGFVRCGELMCSNDCNNFACGVA
ncbi:uncharacterized protein BJ212DRAFT_158807 [Suillus subaureus]|uniref:Secreted protein n=1 Tax=Suillus subaureus TaxID=48587 RepID=A0A9P7JEC9_9AGAM|nr:uncharacterized protein BJ212DRAFT_158807 [Suillus subaureus]KAG1817242.1 hypothetical protein BJ212DRAFT_158807 [Suillus subaureus]